MKFDELKEELNDYLDVKNWMKGELKESYKKPELNEVEFEISNINSESNDKLGEYYVYVELLITAQCPEFKIMYDQKQEIERKVAEYRAKLVKDDEC